MMLWKCPKCKLQWQQKIEKCPYCFGEIQKEEPKNLKVIGATKVFLSSKQHPKVPYNILLLEDENGNKFSKKTMEKYRISESYPRKRKSMLDVVVQKIKYDLDYPIEQCINIMDESFKEAEEILINPGNLSALLSNKHLREIHRELITRTISLLGNEKSFSIALPSKAIKDKKILGKILGREQGKNLGVVAVEDCLKIDFKFLLNMPILATDERFMLKGATLNLLNLTGGLKNEKETVDKVLLISKNFKSIFSLCDAQAGVEGNSFNRISLYWHFIASSNDPIALDSVLCKTFSVPIPKYLSDASQKGLGKSNLKDISIDKNDADSLRIDAVFPSRFRDYSPLKEKFLKKVMLWKMKR